jgi:hypothetical protein
MQTTSTSLSADIAAAFAAHGAGSATPEQGALRDAVLAAFPELLSDPGVVDTIAAAVGPFAQVYETPYEELGFLRRWVRDQASEADRATPALATMESVYEQILAATNHNGPVLRLANGVNVVGLDDERRRWLVPALNRDTIAAIRSADDMKSAGRAARVKGSVRYHWSVERTFLVPDAAEIGDTLPLPSGGTYLIVYQGDPAIVTKRAFRRALTDLVAAHPVADLLVWDTTGTPATLYSVVGMLGHRNGNDVEWPAHLASEAASLRDTLWG